MENKHNGYKIPVSKKGVYKEVINTDSYYYSGTNFINEFDIETKAEECLGKKQVIEVNIAPFSAMVFELKKNSKRK